MFEYTQGLHSAPSEEEDKLYNSFSLTATEILASGVPTIQKFFMTNNANSGFSREELDDVEISAKIPTFSFPETEIQENQQDMEKRTSAQQTDLFMKDGWVIRGSVYVG